MNLWIIPIDLGMLVAIALIIQLGQKPRNWLYVNLIAGPTIGLTAFYLVVHFSDLIWGLL